MISKELSFLLLVLLPDNQKELSHTLLIWLLLKSKVGTDAYTVQKQSQFGSLGNDQTDLKVKNQISGMNMNYDNKPQIHPQPQGKTTKQEISTSHKACSRQFDFAFARASNCTACVLSAGIVLAVMCSRYGEATTLGLAAHVFSQAAQTSVAIGKAGANKSSSVQSEDKN